MTETIDSFIPVADVRERHEILVNAPAEVVFEVAENFELQSIMPVRAIFWLRSKVLGARYQRLRKGIVKETLALGWGRLARAPGRELVMGSVTQPWVGEVKFRGLDPSDFAAFAQPGVVKIVWTLEAEPAGPDRTRFRTQTRVLATDDGARKKFRAYWRKFGAGILLIRWLCLPALKKEAERQYQQRTNRPASKP